MAYSLNRQQLLEFKKSFRAQDVNNDGRITIEQLRAIMKKVGPPFTEQQFHLIIEHIETDFHGNIKLTQFLAFLQEQVPYTQLGNQSDDDLQHVLQFFDKNNKGYITKDELCQSLRQLGQQMSLKDVGDLLEAADFKGKDVISKLEFLQLMQNK